MEEYQDQSLRGRVFRRLRNDILSGVYKEHDELRAARSRGGNQPGGFLRACRGVEHTGGGLDNGQLAAGGDLSHGATPFPHI